VNPTPKTFQGSEESCAESCINEAMSLDLAMFLELLFKRTFRRPTPFAGTPSDNMT
jgi:disulfide oxidoreductase YuzD